MDFSTLLPYYQENYNKIESNCYAKGENEMKYGRIHCERQQISYLITDDYMCLKAASRLCVLAWEQAIKLSPVTNITAPERKCSFIKISTCQNTI